MAADLIDSARYDSPQQAVYGDLPAFRINASLAVGETDEYTCFLVRQLRANSLEVTANLPEVQTRYEQFRKLRERGMKGFVRTKDLATGDGFVLTDDGILLFSVDGSDGMIRTGGGAKITAMRNPWVEFPSVPLGEIFRRFGGGGHQRVASTRWHGKGRADVIQTLMSLRQARQSTVEEPMAPA